MNGAEFLVDAARHSGIDVCFANPGRTELPFVDALRADAGMRACLGLTEFVCAGAADGYSRMADRPVMNLFHFGVGLGNAVANLHNARRAGTPILNIVGVHPAEHAEHDVYLTSDVATLARNVSTVVRDIRDAGSFMDEIRHACAEVLAGGQVTVIVPSDLFSSPVTDGGTWRPPTVPAARVIADEVTETARMLRAEGVRGALLLGGRALRERGLRAASRIADVTGCGLFTEVLSARIDHVSGLRPVTRLHYFPELIRPHLARHPTIVQVGAALPWSFYSFPDQPSLLAPEGCSIRALGGSSDAEEWLVALAEEIGPPRSADAAGEPVGPTARSLPQALTRDTVAAVLADGIPEHAIVVDEAHSVSFSLSAALHSAPAHTVLSGVVGGGPGGGLPIGLGAAMACPDRRVVVVQGDGSAFFGLPALWSYAREGVDVVTVVLSNRKYQLLAWEARQLGFGRSIDQRTRLVDFDDTPTDWVGMSGAFGLPAQRCTDADSLRKALVEALATDGPSVIEAVMK